MGDRAQPQFDLLGANAVDRGRAQAVLAEAVGGGDDGELFLELRKSEGLVFDNGRLKSASYGTAQGFGLRVVAGEAVGYAHASEISESALRRAAAAASAVKRHHAGVVAAAPARSNQKLYTDVSPLDAPDFAAKTALLAEIDAYARARDERVRQVSVSLTGEFQSVEILRADGASYRDQRPLVRLNVAIVAEKNGRQESGTSGGGGRLSFKALIDPASWRHHVDEALRQALVNLESVPAPAGEMDVVLASGWAGIILHEAVGHGLEGEFNRKKTSAFSGLLGERVAAAGVSVVDDGSIADRRGSLSIDDEGTPTGTTVLIEDGILVGYMQDRQNARLMGMTATGNGRRQSYAHVPMPRMTNTYMRAGDKDPEEIIASVKNGIHAVNFGGGQVDIVSGKFVFSCTEAYRIENGRLGPPLKGATLIGNGPDALTRVAMVGNDMKLDPGVGTCGKAGQGVPVGVGQPTVRIDRLTVGGTG